MKKITFIFALLCVSVMGWATAEGEYMGTQNDSYANQFKWYSLSGATAPDYVDIIQAKNDKYGIYVNVGTDLFDGVKYNGVVVASADLENYYAKQGAGAWFYVDRFTTKCTSVEVTNGGTVVRGFRIQNDNGTGDACETGGGSDPGTINWDAISFVPGSTQFKVGALSASNLPNEVVNIQKPGWSVEKGIYMTFPSADQLSCSLPYAKQGAGIVLYLSSCMGAQETEVTVSWNDGSRTFYVYNNAPMTLPAAKAATPTIAASRVRPVYSQYEYNTGMTMAGWSSGMTKNDVRVDNRTFPSYKFGNYLGLGYGTINVSNMDKIHLDIWTENSFTINFYIVGNGESSKNLSLTGGEWNSFDIALSEFTPDKASLKEFKFAEASIGGQTIFLDNIYFYANADLPDPDPSQIEDTNFALRTNGSIAYGSTINGENYPAKAIDGDNGTQFETIYDTDPQILVIDLGQRRIFNTITIFWGNQWAQEFYLETSNNGTDWTEAKHISANTTNHANNEQSFELDNNVTARYIRFRGIVRANGWGYTIKEFKALLSGVPVLTSVSISSNKKIAKVGEYAALTVEPKDQNNSPIAADISYVVSPADAGHVTDGKYYPEKYGLATITVTATTSNAEVSNSVEVWGVVSDNLALNHAFQRNEAYVGTSWGAYTPNRAVDEADDTEWQGSTTNGNINDSRIYDAWFVMELPGNYNLQLVTIHFEGACSDEYYLYGLSSSTYSDNAADWNELYAFSGTLGINNHTDYISTANLNGADNVHFLKFVSKKAATDYGMKIFDVQVYGAEASTSKTVSASVNPAGYGTATVTAGGNPVSEVESGTQVTFTATPASGYDFVNWTQGSVVVSTDAEYVTNITANTALVANFEATRTAYCSTAITDNTYNSTLYVSITNPSGNTYKILVEGTATNRIESAYNNFNFVLSHINGESGNTALPASSWTTDNTGYGSAYVTFTADNFRDITFVQRYIVLNKQGGGLMEFKAFPDASLIQWSATCIDSDAPVLEVPVATPIGATSVRLDLTATDLIAGLLTYHVNYKPTGDTGAGENINIQGASGETTSKTITGLSNGVEYTFSVTVTDGTNESAAQVCTATPAMSAAPVPTTNAKYVLSVYSDAYETALAHDFSKNTWTGIPYTELDINGDHSLAYTNPNLPAQMPDVAWGVNNNGDEAIIALDEFNDGTNKGLDVRGMTYIHFDIWSSTATIYPELRLNDTEAGHFSLNGNGWQSIELPLAGISTETLRNIRWIKFIALRDPAPDQIVIDNVYFYAVPEDVSFENEGNNDALIEAKHKHFVNATINRTFPNTDEWYTLCLPFDLSDAQLTEVFGAGYTLAELVSSEDRGSLIHLNFDYSPEFKAGKAYLLRLGTGVTSAPTFNGVVIKNVDPEAEASICTHMHFQGTFDYITLNQANQRFVGPENYLYTPDPNGTHMKAFRCYFTIPANAPNNVMGKRAKIVFGPQATTEIENVSEQAAPAKFMMDGVLYIIRDGKTYNAQGMLVK